MTPQDAEDLERLLAAVVGLGIAVVGVGVLVGIRAIQRLLGR